MMYRYTGGVRLQSPCSSQPTSLVSHESGSPRLQCHVCLFRCSKVSERVMWVGPGRNQAVSSEELDEIAALCPLLQSSQRRVSLKQLDRVAQSRTDLHAGQVVADWHEDPVRYTRKGMSRGGTQATAPLSATK